VKTIVEVGAHEGFETENFLADKEARVFAFEPNHDAFRPLQGKSKIYTLSRLTMLPFAVDLGNNQEMLFLYPDGKSTLANPYFRPGNPMGYSMVWTMRLDTFMDLYSIDTINYLRIDAPFHEENCLESLGTRIKDVEKGRIRVYEEHNLVLNWLHEHGFQAEINPGTSTQLLPDVRFWR